MVPALVLAAALGSGLSLELTTSTPEVPVGGEVRLRVVLRAEGRTPLTADLCGRLGDRSNATVTIWLEGPRGREVYKEGPPAIYCYAVVYTGRTRRGGSCPAVHIVLHEGWTRPAEGELSIYETEVAAGPGVLTFTLGYDGLTSNPVQVRVRER